MRFNNPLPSPTHRVTLPLCHLVALPLLLLLPVTTFADEMAKPEFVIDAGGL